MTWNVKVTKEHVTEACYQLSDGVDRDSTGTNELLMLQLGLFWTVVETASMSIRSGDVLSAYIYLLTGTNSDVGFVQGVNGGMQVTCLYRTLAFQPDISLSCLAGRRWISLSTLLTRCSLPSLLGGLPTTHGETER